ncbi:FUSC family membrane protein [Rufibacter sediminis]|uniref:FUSC family protein n=1 Tax=Rufibacter sediminis TaxID=2762756 RepID=A0ABR6VQ71_9BACT|nr:FUSC family membrane protein [Rufibacter sediminis]MBC3539344.1 FUSC family protein [Rufibacter sediminis]
MNRKVRELQYFFYSQNFYDGIRTTVAALIPSLVFSQLGHFELGVTMSLGAIGVSLADSPGPERHKRNGMLLCIGVCTLMALVTGFARMHVVTMGLAILVSCFVLSMLLVYGMRASFIGLAGLMVLVLTMDRPMEPREVLLYSGLVMAGGGWYLVLSLLSNTFMPYRPAQQALGECLREVAKFIRIKASFYQPQANLEEGYRQVIAQQVLVSDKQDALRELLFKSRQMMKESTNRGHTLVMTFVDMVDLYEQVTAIHYDYASIREKYGPTGILPQFAATIMALADELDNIGFAIQANQPHRNRVDVTGKLDQLKTRIDALEEREGPTGHLALKKIFVNVRSIAQRLSDIRSYFTSDQPDVRQKARQLEFSPFISHQTLDPKLFLSNLTMESSVFRFSFRVALVALFAYILTKLFPYGQHSYWVLLTVIFLLKPAFSLTKQRNKERVIGTVVGGALGLLVLYLVEDHTLQFFFMLVFMTSFYSVQRINYVLSVILMTPFMLILFSFLGGGGLTIVQERVVDTLVGCAIAFAATYFVFPNWESKQVGRLLKNMVQANLNYLQVLADGLAGKAVAEMQYKLARKEVYVNAANLSAAFQRMAGEPKSKQRHRQEIYQFVVLNHILSSYIATIVSTQTQREPVCHPKSLLRSMRRALFSLTEALQNLDPAFKVPEHLGQPTEAEVPEKTSLTSDELLLKEQLEFIRKVSTDITKLTTQLKAEQVS